MVVTKELLEAYLKCPRKACLKNSDASSNQNKCNIWRIEYQEKLRKEGLDFLQQQYSHEAIRNPDQIELLKKGSRLYLDYFVESKGMTSRVDGVGAL